MLLAIANADADASTSAAIVYDEWAFHAKMANINRGIFKINQKFQYPIKIHTLSYSYTPHTHTHTLANSHIKYELQQEQRACDW